MILQINVNCHLLNNYFWHGCFTQLTYQTIFTSTYHKTAHDCRLNTLKFFLFEAIKEEMRLQADEVVRRK